MVPCLNLAGLAILKVRGLAMLSRVINFNLFAGSFVVINCSSYKKYDIPVFSPTPPRAERPPLITFMLSVFFESKTYVDIGRYYV